MRAMGLTQILNVSDMAESFAWFESFGWSRIWDWGDPPTFGAVRSGGCEIFLCHRAQGGTSRLPAGRPARDSDDDEGNRGVWMSLWVGDVDQVYQECQERGVAVLHAPEDMPWGVREMLVRHPDGHVFRVGRGLDLDDPATIREPSLPIERVDVAIRLEKRLAAVLADLAAHKGMTVSACLEETLLHTFEQTTGGVASPHSSRDFDAIEAARERHGLDYDTHASYRFVESGGNGHTG